MATFVFVMKKMFSVLMAVSAVFALCSCASTEAKQPRKIAVQMWSTHFHKFDYSIERLAKMGVKYVECYPSQPLSDKMPDARFSHNMTAEQKAFAKKVLADNGIKMISYGRQNRSRYPQSLRIRRRDGREDGRYRSQRGHYPDLE